MPPGTPSLPDWLNVLFNVGTGAFVLWWFMFRMTPAVLDLSRAMDRVTRSLVTLTLTVAQKLSHCDAIEEQCANLQKELDAAESARDKKT